MGKKLKDGILGSRASKQVPVCTSERAAPDEDPGKRLLWLACTEPGNRAVIPSFLDLTGRGKKFCFHFLRVPGNTEVT